MGRVQANTAPHGQFEAWRRVVRRLLILQHDSQIGFAAALNQFVGVRCLFNREAVRDQRPHVELASSHQVEHGLDIALLGPANVGGRIIVPAFFVIGIVTPRAVGTGNDELGFLEIKRPTIDRAARRHRPARRVLSYERRQQPVRSAPLDVVDAVITTASTPRPPVKAWICAAQGSSLSSNGYEKFFCCFLAWLSYVLLFKLTFMVNLGVQLSENKKLYK